MTRETRPTCSASSVTTPRHHGGKKIGLKPGAGDTEKRTNEIGTILPLLETLPDIEGRTITADALLTQRALATYLLDRGADYLFTVKGNQPTLLDDTRRRARTVTSMPFSASTAARCSRLRGVRGLRGLRGLRGATPRGGDPRSVLVP